MKNLTTKYAQLPGPLKRLLLRPAEVAEMIGVSRTAVYDLMRRGEIPFILVGERKRIPVDALDAWIQRGIKR